MALCHSAAILFAMALPASSIFPMALRCSAPAGSPLCRRSPACNSFATAPLPATNLIGAPASNKPHPAEKSTPVWLAIWRTWAGFANSQHRDAALATPDNICAHSSLLQTLSSCSDRRKSVDPSAPIAYATSVSPPDEAAAWPRCSGVGCWMRLLPGKGAGDGWQIMLLVVRVAVPANHRAL